jgi:hypothetical protein
MNKSVLIGISIAIIAVIVGVYSVSLENNTVEEPTPQSENQGEYQPKKYTQTLSENIAIKTP